MLRERGTRLYRDAGNMISGGWHPMQPLTFEAAADLAAACNLPTRRFEHHSDGSTVIRVGKKTAGHLLDGRPHQELPA